MSRVCECCKFPSNVFNSCGQKIYNTLRMTRQVKSESRSISSRFYKKKKTECIV